MKVLLLRDSYKKLYDEGYSNPFRPGMSATVDIQTETRLAILSVPIQAVTTRSDSAIAKMEKKELEEAGKKDKEKESAGKDQTDDQAENEIEDKSENAGGEKDREISDELLEVVFMVKDNKAVLRRVKTGIQDNNFIQIAEGLEEGDEVIVAPYNAVSTKLELDSPVEVVDEDDLFNDKKKKKNK